MRIRVSSRAPTTRSVSRSVVQKRCSSTYTPKNSISVSSLSKPVSSSTTRALKSTRNGASSPFYSRRTFATTTMNDINSKKLTVELTKTPKEKLQHEKLIFGKTFSDHILEVDWTADKGWGAPAIRPYHSISLDPSCAVFHYAMECFEGMKAYIDKNDDIRLFRPTENMRRMNSSAARLYFPGFDGNELLNCLKEFLRVEKSWIPKQRGYSLYIRPTLISTQASLGVGPSSSVKLFVIACPVGPYYPEGFKPVKLLVDEFHVRSWVGGTGSEKVGANYAPTIAPQMAALKKGYSQILWLNGDNLAEVGTMNFFIFWKLKSGEFELVTPPLDGTILPGVTRDSILQLTRNWREFKVSERPVSIHDFLKALDEGRVIEAFGAGTAAIVSPVKAVSFKGVEHAVPLQVNDPSANAGALTQRIADQIMGIQYGDIPHEWSVKVPSKEHDHDASKK